MEILRIKAIIFTQEVEEVQIGANLRTDIESKHLYVRAGEGITKWTYRDEIYNMCRQCETKWEGEKNKTPTIKHNRWGWFKKKEHISFV